MSVRTLVAGVPIGPALRRGLATLARARSLAADVGRDVWDFAVEADRLRAEGVTACDLRWLTCRGWVVHAREADPTAPRRRFVSPGGLNFPPGTCFVLTGLGSAVVSGLRRPARSGPAALPVLIDLPAQAPPAAPRPASDRPAWDVVRRELRVGGRLVKRFRVPAPVQELILTAFEEEGWPPRMDDPLPVDRGLEPKRRLQSAIFSLNRNRRLGDLRFLGDGNGTGVCWAVRGHRDASAD